jgi:DNA-binding LytR/AlgR family response regulator
MSKINVLIVEDEAIVSKDIQQSLKKLGYNVVGSSATGESALQLVQTEHPDIVLMDIMLKGEMNGIQTADKIKEEYATPIIFLTAYADEATLLKAKITEPYGYILKPFKEIDLHTNIEMAIYKHAKEQEVVQERNLFFSVIERNESNKKSIYVKSNSKLIKLNKDDIFYIEALKDYVIIHTPDLRYTIHSTMKDIEAKIGSDEFLRVHRSYIVRIDKIATIEYPNLTLEQVDKTIPIGGSYREELYQKINQV